MIEIPKPRELVLPISMRNKVSGHFKIHTQAKGGPMRLRAEFDNLITNNGLDLLTSGGTFFTTCAVGSGNATPSNTDTALQSLVGSTTGVISNTRSVQPSSPYYGTATLIFNFPVGTATGNLAEVGVGATTTSLMSRALILNGSMAPTTITVLSNEALYVTYQLNQYVPTSDVTGSVTIAGTAYGYTLRAAEATSNNWGIASEGPFLAQALAYNGSIGAITALPSGSQGSADTVATGSYTVGSYSLTYTATWGLTSGNLSGGVSAIAFFLGSSGQTRGAFQIGLGASIPKTGSYVMTLSFSSVWSR